MTLTVARDQIETFVNALFRYADEGSFVQMRAFRDDIDGVWRPERWRAEAINGSGLRHIVDAAADLASECAAAPEPVVFAGPVATFKIADRAAEKDLRNGLVLTVECDEAPEAARKKLETVLGPATVVVASGGLWTDRDTGENCAKASPALAVEEADAAVLRPRGAERSPAARENFRRFRRKRGSDVPPVAVAGIMASQE
jgi:hypothetical protein